MFDPLRPGFVVADTPPTEDQLAVVAVTGGQLNPDTNLPMPSPTNLQRQLIAELTDRLGDGPLVAREDAAAILTEAVVRQHGRTVRAVIRSAYEHAEGATRLSREHAEKAAATSDLGQRAAELYLACSHASNARLLARLHLDARA